ncbi:integrin-linked kinase-associated serine/threonine phosphatase 2C-like [Zophobas morio]|uniref:integrin-linked kinase-associated serine/threonine phosphatase 2C-like n=1 Tax=Zophobas morio TaxID=2755281 RepID=UPI0030836D10
MMCTLTLLVEGSRGERDEMQDAHSIVIDLWSLEDKDDSKIEAFKRKRLSFFSVYDGHSGAKAATYCENVLHKNLLNNIQSMLEMKMEGLLDADDALCNSSGELSPKHITRCILDAFKQTNSDFIKIVQKERLKDGCTAVVALLYGDLLYTANLGDSAAILAAETDCRSLKCFPLSKEHTASVYSERMRIQKAGGTVKNGRVEGVIEVSRSIGDAAFKHLGVICTPEIKIDNFSTEKLHPHFVILGCDGLWSKMQKQDVVKFVGDFLSAESTHQAVEEILEQQDLQLPDENLLSVEERVKYKVQRTVRYRKMTVQMAVKALVNEAVKRGSSDNVSALLIFFGKNKF